MYSTGDIISVPKFPAITHYGVVVGWSEGLLYVVHGDPAAGKAVLVTIDRFAAGRIIRLERRFGDDAVDVANRALDQLGTPYDLFSSNCEHLATYAATGRARSDQVAAGIGLAFIGGLLYLGSRSTYDPYVDRYRGSDGRFRAW